MKAFTVTYWKTWRNSLTYKLPNLVQYKNRFSELYCILHKSQKQDNIFFLWMCSCAVCLAHLLFCKEEGVYILLSVLLSSLITSELILWHWQCQHGSCEDFWGGRNCRATKYIILRWLSYHFFKNYKTFSCGNLYLGECRWLHEVCTEGKSPANFKQSESAGGNYEQIFFH
jgi:hypothetical protein